jgi:hypothetical protein
MGFVGLMAYSEHYKLIQELIRRGLTLEEDGGILSMDYT